MAPAFLVRLGREPIVIRQQGYDLCQEARVTVTGARDEGSDFPDPKAIACVVDTLGKIRFSGGASASMPIVVPFKFVPAASADAGAN